MQELFARTLSQGLQAFMPVAVWLSWLQRTKRGSRVASVRLGLLAAIPLTACVAWLFDHSPYQARWESVMAVAATGLALAGGWCVWRGDSSLDAAFPDRRGARLATSGATAVLVIRQTMVIAAVLGAAMFQIRSLDATAAVASAALVALCAGYGWIWAANRLSRRAILDATKTFAALFLAQAAFYAFHKSAEARFLPWSDLLETATEPYGPDSIFGRYVSYLLVGAPFLTAAWSMARGDERPAPNPGPSIGRRAALTAAAVILAICVGLAATWARRTMIPHADGAAAVMPAGELTSLVAAPHLVFISRGIDASSAAVSVASLNAPTSGRAPTGLRCQRVSFAAGGGICLQADRGVFTTYQATLFDDQFQPRMSFVLEGAPSRTRVSADGRVGAITVFVTGQVHGYASASFSTKTILVDMASGDILGDLEQFSTWREGKRFSAPDFNFWGVTFARDSGTFYATLQSAGKTYLVRGDLALRKLTVIHENVECPSLSPNNRLIAYKKKSGPSLAPWRFYVLDLATMNERPINAEPRSIDDQIEWLDDGHVLYAGSQSSQSADVDVYIAAIEGGEPARVFIPSAESPIVVR
jgi:hypothetical protein